MTIVTALKHSCSTKIAPSKRVKPQGFSQDQTALCSVERFASALFDPSRVVSSLAEIGVALDADRLVMIRALSGETEHRRIASFPSDGDNRLNHDAVTRLATTPEAEAGQFHEASNDRGETTVLIVLRAEVGSLDIMQLTFDRSPTPEIVASLGGIAPALAVAWGLRQPGLASALIASHTRTRRPTYTEQGNVAILDFENAYGLSRAEFRVCRLLGLGLKPAAIAQELGLSIATIRSHLRSIYSKTDLSGQVAVVSHLFGGRPGDLRVA
ncbi:Bacterial regulatory proteins, luxR family [Roseovarius gaetbuli]|uniref:Bacterial regulatory proteins, luxR family n=1 Tax=Roseovarius gaetbuli TaxID=1356575 RepID=A0A1X7AC18_9RHOB|nr:helix-turn-helix transcriptional regulator [Roseovarius gaetbuli]SLN73877.1 Bacterial regulatory proteins, luxR family [Roseovarius gaetbuli]